MRGKVLCFRQVRQSGGITPAYAGKRYTYLIQMLCDRDHPRVCGEKGFSAFLGNCCAGSPPRMRGKADLCIGSERQTGITPAYAGKRERTGRLRRQAKDHPRVCGEKVSSTSPMKCLKGSPPRMRGKVWDILQPLADWGITPAYAGKRSSHAPRACIYRDHPRVCGEKLPCLLFLVCASGSPPRMRGKDCRSSKKHWKHGITPAYAGKRLKRSHSIGHFSCILCLFHSVLHRASVSDGSRAGPCAPPCLPAQNAVPV